MGRHARLGESFISQGQGQHVIDDNEKASWFLTAGRNAVKKTGDRAESYNYTYPAPGFFLLTYDSVRQFNQGPRQDLIIHEGLGLKSQVILSVKDLSIVRYANNDSFLITVRKFDDSVESWLTLDRFASPLMNINTPDITFGFESRLLVSGNEVLIANRTKTNWQYSTDSGQNFTQIDTNTLPGVVDYICKVGTEYVAFVGSGVFTGTSPDSYSLRDSLPATPEVIKFVDGKLLLVFNTSHPEGSGLYEIESLNPLTTTKRTDFFVNETDGAYHIHDVDNKIIVHTLFQLFVLDGALSLINEVSMGFVGSPGAYLERYADLFFLTHNSRSVSIPTQFSDTGVFVFSDLSNDFSLSGSMEMELAPDDTFITVADPAILTNIGVIL